MRIQNKILIFLVLVGFILPNFSSINSLQVAFIQAQQPTGPPETLEEAKKIGEKALGVAKEELPGTLERIWKEEVFPIWKKMWDFAKKPWQKFILPWLKNIWQKIKSLFNKAIGERGPVIKEEFKKEKQELKEEVPKVTKSLWERLKELIK